MKIFALLTLLFSLSLGLGGQERLTIFETRTEFTDRCPVDSLTFEDFANGPTSFTACDGPVSAAGDDCFPEGEIQSGFEVTTSESGASQMLFFPAGSFGVNNNAVGADAFLVNTIINFTDSTTAVNAVAFDLHSALGDGAPILVRVFGEQGMIDSLIVDAPQDAPVFLGMVSPEPIVSIELENLDLVLEHIALLLFGECERPTSILESNFSGFNYYPNPVNNRLSLRNELPMERVTVYDVAGREVETVKPFAMSFELNTSEYPQGVYFLKVIVNNVAKTYQVVKK